MKCPHSKLAEIDSAKDILRENGYYVENLWNVQDIKSFYKCSDEIALSVLDHALNGNDYVTMHTWDMIDKIAKNFGLELRDDEKSI